MLRILVKDNQEMARKMRKSHKVCDDANDPASASILEIYIDEAERRTWFLFEASRAQDSTDQ